MQEAINYLKGLPLFMDVAQQRPPEITEGHGSHIHPFDNAQRAAALGKAGCYTSGCNFFWLNMMHTFTPGVPISNRSVMYYMTHFFSSPPTKFPDTIAVSILKGTPIQTSALERVSPCEASWGLKRIG